MSNISVYTLTRGGTNLATSRVSLLAWIHVARIHFHGEWLGTYYEAFKKHT
jgi:hypothetical protein